MDRKQLKQIEKMLSQTSTLTQNYKKVLMASMEHGDLETALYLRFLMELSVRSRDALQIRLLENKDAILRNHGSFIYIELENMQERKKFRSYYRFH